MTPETEKRGESEFFQQVKGKLKSAEKEIAEFIADMKKNQWHALNWADGVFKATAIKIVASELLKADGEISEVALRAHLLKQMIGSSDAGRSTSASANLLRDEIRCAWTDFYNVLSWHPHNPSPSRERGGGVKMVDRGHQCHQCGSKEPYCLACQEYLVLPWLAWSKSGPSGPPDKSSFDSVDHWTINGVSTLCGMKQIGGSDKTVNFNHESPMGCKKCRAVVAKSSNHQ